MVQEPRVGAGNADLAMLGLDLAVLGLDLAVLGLDLAALELDLAGFERGKKAKCGALDLWATVSIVDIHSLVHRNS
jgi:hypothetical protein